MNKEIICIVCPRSCHVLVEGGTGAVESVSGNQCARGEKYARQEFIDPRRILTSSVRLEGSGRIMLPVRSSGALPRDLLLRCMAEIKRCAITPPVALHQPVIRDILGTGIDIITCMPVEKEA